MPFVQAIALSGSEAVGYSRQGSDIDLLVIAQPGRLWLARLVVSGYFQLFGVRRHGRQIADRFCLNHYLAGPKVMDPEMRHLYTARDYVSLVPYLGADAIWQFQQNNAGWIRGFFPQARIVQYPAADPSWASRAITRLAGNRFGDAAEKLAAWLQRSRIHIEPHIFIKSDELAFHPHSKAHQVLEKFLS